MLTLKEKTVGTKGTENKEQRLYFVDELSAKLSRSDQPF
jgi:hypothetical protein